MDAFKFVTNYVINGFDPNHDASEWLHPFKHNESSWNEPSEFLVDFLGADGARYSYDISIKNGEIEFATLRSYNGNRSIRIFERECRGENLSLGHQRGGVTPHGSLCGFLVCPKQK